MVNNKQPDNLLPVCVRLGSEILCKYNRKTIFVQMVLNNRKSIFEFYRIKNVTL